MQSRYVGKTAFITGAARGQGRAHAVRLAQEGADVAVLDVCATFPTTGYAGPTEDDLAETVRLVEAEGRRALSYVADVRDMAAVQAAVDDSVDRLDGLDVVIANAGICAGSRFVDLSLEQWKATIDVNLSGTFHTLKAVVPSMVERGRGGAICVVSSVAGLRGLPYLADYVASKHAITGLARTVANELAEHRIRVNTIHPAAVPTGMAPPALGELFVQDAHTLAPIFMNALPVGHTEPEGIAAAVAWLCSDEASTVTGVALPIDMGTLIR